MPDPAPAEPPGGAPAGDPAPARAHREPTTIRFTKATLKDLARARHHFLMEQDLRVTQSDLVEAAVLQALRDLEALAETLREVAP